MKASSVVLFRNLLLFLTLAIATVACKKDDEEEKCVPPALKSHIVGTWDATITGTTTTPTVPLTFTADGKVQGEIGKYLALFLPNKEIDETIKYETTGETTVRILATSKGNPVDPLVLTVGTRTCEQIPMSYLVVTITLNKKK